MVLILSDRMRIARRKLAQGCTLDEAARAAGMSSSALDVLLWERIG